METDMKVHDEALAAQSRPAPCMPSATHPFGLESSGQSGRATKGLPPLCTVGAAEFAPPASGRTALFSTAIEFVVFSSPLPDVADPVVVQLVSGFSLEGVVDCAAAGPMTNVPTRIAAAARSIFVSMTEDRLLNSIQEGTCSDGYGSIAARRVSLRGKSPPDGWLGRPPPSFDLENA